MHLGELRLVETVCLDGEKLEEICLRLGYRGGEEAICAAMEELAMLLQQAGKLLQAGETGALEDVARRVHGSAERIGMVALARVAGEVVALAAGYDPAALGAVAARMRRLGEQSLLAIWDRQDLMI